MNIVGLSERKIMNVDNLMQIIEFGTGVRVTAQNGTNGKISFIDLAGSERAADHADQL